MTTPVLGIKELPNSVYDPTSIVNGLLSGIEVGANNKLLGNYAIDSYFDVLGAIVDYKMDEASGNIVDRKGVQDLTATGTLTYQSASGWDGAGDGINFDGSTGYFVASNASVFDSASVGSVAVCFNADTLPGSGSVCLTAYADDATTDWSFLILLTSDGRMTVSLRTSSSSSQWVYQTAASIMSASTVYSFIVNQDGVNPTCWVNGASITLTEVEASLDAGTWLDALTDSENLCVGALDRSTTVNYFDGKIYRVVYMTNGSIDATIAQNIHNALEFGYSGATS